MHSTILPTDERFVQRKVGLVTRAQRRLARFFRYQRSNAVLARLLLAVCAMATIYRVFFFSVSPINIDIDGTGSFEFYDYSKQQSSGAGASAREERILLCTPLRNAEDVIDLMFDHLQNLTYPHHLIDLAFLVSDSDDKTEELLEKRAKLAFKLPQEERFGSVDIFKRSSFGATVGQGFDDRHGVAVQGVRRKLMGRARNWLLSAALKPHHSWVYWRDADIETSPKTILEDLMAHDRDVIVPNVWRPLPKWLGGQQPYDLNSWMESEAALELAKTLDEDEVIVEGYAEYPTWRPHLAYFRREDGMGNINDIVDLDGIGGVSILAKAKVFRAGINFPGFAFENHAETEGFGKMARKQGFSVAGLPQYTIWHKYEPSVDDIREMKERERQGLPID
ncbi:Mannan polymerase I complex VAN1 subunit [Wickerhamiella sorbophila]|uniref:Mannan polymerase I complex VAN1 subunit n=1 Tax=Wickerhamiella sorbophila TaxID=45607 RepID=A0A2T0FIU0_9ASCO|nr:Mannan polymerase I complex VAN1 subunit [Wickerhamiella sorbophila]PRT54908.1 Mannan polymerase I complex VAN1 subunit [Wickerhamiella sorbophila]